MKVFYLDADTVPVEGYLDKNGWVSGESSDILVEEAMTKAEVDEGGRYNGDKYKSVSRFVLHPKSTISIPRTKRSLELKLARKVSLSIEAGFEGSFGDTNTRQCGHQNIPYNDGNQRARRTRS